MRVVGRLKARTCGVLEIIYFRQDRSCDKTSGVACFARDDLMKFKWLFNRASDRLHTFLVSVRVVGCLKAGDVVL